jgi:hypothetical protein
MKLTARNAAIAGEHENGSVRLENSQSRHQVRVVSVTTAVQEDSIQRSFKCQVKRGGAVVGRQDPITTLTQGLSDFS